MPKPLTYPPQPAQESRGWIAREDYPSSGALSGRPALVLVVDDLAVRVFPGGPCRAGVTGQVWMPFNQPIVPVQKFNRIV